MKRETCADCEKMFIDAAIACSDLDIFLDRDIWQISDKICIKCLTRITNRYLINKE